MRLLKGLSALVAHGPADGVLHKFARAVEGKFFLDMSLIRFHRLNAEVQLGRDLPGSVSLTNKTEDLELTIAELGDRRGLRWRVATHVVTQHVVGDSIAYIDLVTEDAAQ